MRVTVVTSRFPTLSETFIVNHAAGLSRHGVDVRVVAERRGLTEQDAGLLDALDSRVAVEYAAPRPAGKISTVAAAARLLLRRARRDPRWLRAVSWRDLRSGTLVISSIFLADAVCRDLAPQVIHTHFGPIALQIERYRRAGVLPGPLIATFHGSDLNIVGARAAPHRYRQLARSAVFCTVGSRFMKGVLSSLGVPDDKIEIVPMGIDVDTFPHQLRSRTPGEPLRILTVGRLVEVKGHAVVFRALAELGADAPRYEYHIIGNGPLRSSLERMVGELKLDDKVIFHGGVLPTEVKRFYGQSDVFVLAGVRAADGSVEGQGLVLLEAQCSGLPVITSDAGGAPEQVVDDVTALVAPAGDFRALARKLALLLGDARRRREMGDAGRAHVVRNYDQKALMSRWVALYERAASLHPPRDQAG